MTIFKTSVISQILFELDARFDLLKEQLMKRVVLRNGLHVSKHHFPIVLEQLKVCITFETYSLQVLKTEQRALGLPKLVMLIDHIHDLATSQQLTNLGGFFN